MLSASSMVAYARAEAALHVGGHAADDVRRHVERIDGAPVRGARHIARH